MISETDFEVVTLYQGSVDPLAVLNESQGDIIICNYIFSFFETELICLQT